MEEEEAAFRLHMNWWKTKIVQFCNPATCSTVQVAHGQVEVVDSFVYLGSTIDSSGDSRGEILHRIGLAQSCMNLLEKWKSSIRLNTKLRLYQTYVVPVLLCTGVKRGPQWSTFAIALMRLTRGPFGRFYWSPTHLWLPTSLSHHNRQTIAPLCRLATSSAVHQMKIVTVQLHQQSKGLPRTGSDRKENLAIPGELETTSWISASRLHGRRQPVGRSGDLWWTRQRARRVCHKKN